MKISRNLLAASVCMLTAAPVMADPPKEDGLWRGALSASLALAAGNTQSTNLSIGATALKATKEDKLALFLTSLYGTREDAGKTVKAASQTRGGGKYDWNLSDRSYAFGILELEQDKLSSLDLRTVAGAGLGLKLVKEKDIAFEVFGGITQNHEKYARSSRNATELMLGEQSDHKLSESTSFKQRLAFFPNLKNSGEYRAQFDAGLVTSIASGINLQVTLSNRYDSQAPLGTKKTDTLLLTGINIAFGAR